VTLPDFDFLRRTYSQAQVEKVTRALAQLYAAVIDPFLNASQLRKQRGPDACSVLCPELATSAAGAVANIDAFACNCMGQVSVSDGGSCQATDAICGRAGSAAASAVTTWITQTCMDRCRQ